MFKYILKFRTKKHRKKAGFLSLDFGLKGNKWGEANFLPSANLGKIAVAGEAAVTDTYNISVILLTAQLVVISYFEN